MDTQVYGCIFAALHVQITLQHTKSIDNDNKKLKWFDKNTKAEGENVRHLGRVKEVRAYITELQRFLCYSTYFCAKRPP